MLPINSSFSQISDTEPTLGIVLTNSAPFHYKDNEGYTVIIGQVENTKNFAITDVQIWAGFYDDFNLQPLESLLGTTILDVIPANGKSPFMIKSESTNAAITNVSVKPLLFTSTAEKNKTLNIESVDFEVSDRITFSGTITNKGTTPEENTVIYLVFYDVFNPPRLIQISSTVIENPMESDSTINFEFNEPYLPKAKGFKVFAESTSAQSNILDVEVTPPELITKRISINDISITDNEGNVLSDVRINSPINIQSNVQMQVSSPNEMYDQPYVYYTQVRQSGEKALVEFIGTFEGKFENSPSQIPTVEWIPQNKGLFFIETFVWDNHATPIAPVGPIILVLVN